MPSSSPWYVAAIWIFGPLILTGMGWLINIGTGVLRSFRQWQRNQEASLSAFNQGQAKQNETLAMIENELQWWREFREENREEMKNAWGKIDRHEEILHSHEARITKIEAAPRGPHT